MTEHETDPMDEYGLRLGRELHALSARALQPFDAAAIAHEVAVGRRRAARPFALGGATLRAPGRLLLLIVALATAILLALWVVVGQQPSPPLTFAPGSIAYTLDGILSVAAPDGSDPVVIAAQPRPIEGGVHRRLRSRLRLLTGWAAARLHRRDRGPRRPERRRRLDPDLDDRDHGRPARGVDPRLLLRVRVGPGWAAPRGRLGCPASSTPSWDWTVSTRWRSSYPRGSPTTTS